MSFLIICLLHLFVFIDHWYLFILFILFHYLSLIPYFVILICHYYFLLQNGLLAMITQNSLLHQALLSHNILIAYLQLTSAPLRHHNNFHIPRHHRLGSLFLNFMLSLGIRLLIQNLYFHRYFHSILHHLVTLLLVQMYLHRHYFS